MLTVPLKEIKPPVEMNVHLPWEGIILLCFLLLLLPGLLLFVRLWKRKREKKREAERRALLRLLEEVEFSPVREGAYRATALAEKLARTREEKRAATRLKEKLSYWKYKKETPPFDEEIREEIKKYISLLQKREK